MFLVAFVSKLDLKPTVTSTFYAEGEQHVLFLFYVPNNANFNKLKVNAYNKKKKRENKESYSYMIYSSELEVLDREYRQTIQ